MSQKKVVSTNTAPAAIGPYSQAIQAGNLLFLSGQLPVNPKTGEFAGSDVTTQARQSIENIRAILESIGLSLADVVKTTVFLKDMNSFAAMNAVYQEFFPADPPARSCVEVSRLPKDALVEIESVALLPQ